MITSRSASHDTRHLTHPKYRADIDGLRAIAVLSVVGYHAFPKGMKSGFIGVDIFFVISGFLISSIIFSNLERSSFSFIEFYSRRIRRIFPALLLVLIACYVFGWFALLADEYKQLGRHIAGGAGFVSNFMLWKESGYFDNAAETKPLLHLWSLAIEEQFYIVWPLLLAFVWKRRWSFVAITAMVAICSFAFSIFLISKDSAAAFYLPFSRFWELMIGGLLAYITLHKPHWNNKYADIQSVLGVLLLLGGLIFINKARAFPGWYALLPAFGALFLISSGPKAWFNRNILSNKMLVWFGLISYPLYLWHWPLLSYARIVEYQAPTKGVRHAVVIISIALAWLTYRFIEAPIRFGKHGKLTTIILFVLMLIVGCFGYYTYTKDGLPSRAAAQPLVENRGDVGHVALYERLNQKFYACTPDRLREQAMVWEGAVRCFQSQKIEDKRIAIIGDSHAEDLFLGLAEALPKINIVYYIKGSMPLVKGREYEEIFKFVAGDTNITTVIIAAYWSQRLGDIPKESSFEIELNKIIQLLTLAGKEIYIADDVPDFKFDPKKCKYSKIMSRHTCSEDRKVSIKKRSPYYATLESVVKKHPNARLLKLLEYFCSQDSCAMAKDGVLFYRDNSHLNINGSEYIANRIIEDNPLLAR